MKYRRPGLLAIAVLALLVCQGCDLESDPFIHILLVLENPLYQFGITLTPPPEEISALVQNGDPIYTELDAQSSP